MVQIILVYVKFVVNKVATGQVFLQEIQFSPINIIPPVLYTHLQLHVALARRTNGRGL